MNLFESNFEERWGVNPVNLSASQDPQCVFKALAAPQAPETDSFVHTKSNLNRDPNPNPQRTLIRLNTLAQHICHVSVLSNMVGEPRPLNNSIWFWAKERE